MHHKSYTVVFSRLYLSNLGMIKGLVGYALWPYSLVGMMERTLSMWEGRGRVLQIFQKKIVAQEIIDLNISWPSNIF